MEVSWRGIHRYRLSVDVTLVRYSFLIEKKMQNGHTLLPCIHSLKTEPVTQPVR
jgi:hypothetical protein